MVLSEFNKISLAQFRGLFNRGSFDVVPQDHGSAVVNLTFNNRGETLTRWGADSSLNLSHNVRRMFLSTPLDGNYYVFTMDFNSVDKSSRLWRYSVFTGLDTQIYSRNGFHDFCALNMFGRTYVQYGIDPASGGIGHDECVMVWNGTNYRPAAGLAPRSGFSALTAGAGNTDPGKHYFAISFITDTGFITRPGPQIPYNALPDDPSSKLDPVEWTSAGMQSVQLLGLPLGPPGTVARQIFVTKADQSEYYYLADGLIKDNTTTATGTPQYPNLDWIDTDLAVSADDLFDLREAIPSAAANTSASQGGLFKYKGRMFVWGSPYGPPYDGPDRILVSKPGEPESFNNVTGYIQLPTERDGNTIRGAVSLRDVVYFTKPTGIFASQDNLDNPSTWPITQIDGGCGSWYFGISTITASQPSLSQNDIVIFADRGGLYLFDGIVRQPPLTWKINDEWKRLNIGYQHWVTVENDPYNQIIYCLLPVDGQTDPSLLLVGDFSEGLTPEAIKWSIYQFPNFIPRALAMMNFNDASGFDYLPRFGADGNSLMKLTPKRTNDWNGDGQTRTEIPTTWQTFPAGFAPGKMNIFRALVFRGEGVNQIFPVLATADNSVPVNQTEPPAFTPGMAPGKEFTRQINFVSERMMVTLQQQGVFRMSRLDIYGKSMFDSRPL